MDVQFKENRNASVREGHGSAECHAMSPFVIRLVSLCTISGLQMFGTMFDGSVLKKVRY